jgi:hypothetical protein
MRYLIVLASLVLASAANTFAQSARPVSGEYVEARSAEVYTCGCLFSGQAETSGKEAIVAWKIDDGQFAGASLAGLKMAAVIVGEAHLGAYSHRPRSSSIYLDQSATPAQREAALAFLESNYSELLGSIVAVREAPISFRKDNERTYVRIGEVAEVVVRDARLPEDAHPGSTQWYQPFVPLKQTALAMTLYYRFSGHEHPVRWQSDDMGITGFTGAF